MSAYSKLKSNIFLTVCLINIITLFKSLLLTLSSELDVRNFSRRWEATPRSPDSHLSFKYSWYLKNLFQMQNNVRETRRNIYLHVTLSTSKLLLTSAHWPLGKRWEITFCRDSNEPAESVRTQCGKLSIFPLVKASMSWQFFEVESAPQNCVRSDSEGLN